MEKDSNEQSAANSPPKKRPKVKAGGLASGDLMRESTASISGKKLSTLAADDAAALAITTTVSGSGQKTMEKNKAMPQQQKAKNGDIRKFFA